MSKLCDQRISSECVFKDNGTDFVCQNGYVMTAENKERILQKQTERRKYNAF